MRGLPWDTVSMGQSEVREGDLPPNHRHTKGAKQGVAYMSVSELDQEILQTVSNEMDEITDHWNSLARFTFVLIGKDILEKSSFKQGDTILGVEIASDFRHPLKITLGYEIADFSDIMARLEW